MGKVYHALRTPLLGVASPQEEAEEEVEGVVWGTVPDPVNDVPAALASQ
jgi:hypothetical protein